MASSQQQPTSMESSFESPNENNNSENTVNPTATNTSFLQGTLEESDKNNKSTAGGEEEEEVVMSTRASFPMMETIRDEAPLGMTSISLRPYLDDVERGVSQCADFGSSRYFPSSAFSSSSSLGRIDMFPPPTTTTTSTTATDLKPSDSFLLHGKQAEQTTRRRMGMRRNNSDSQLLTLPMTQRTAVAIADNVLACSETVRSGAVHVKRGVVNCSRGINRGVAHLTDDAVMTLFGNEYDKRQTMFVILAGVLMSFNSGMINGCCVSGLVTPNGESSSIAGLTMQYTQSGLKLGAADAWPAFRYNTFCILAYGFGSFLAASISPRARPYRIEPTYGPSYLLGGCMLLISSFAAYRQWHANYIFYFAAMTNGLQNGISSIYSANLIRASMTGVTVDIFVAVGQWIRGSPKAQTWKAFVLFLIAISFWFGGFVAYFMAHRFLAATMFFNAVLFYLIGLLLIVFLVYNLDISVKDSILGTWGWKQVMHDIMKQRGFEDGGLGDPVVFREQLLDLFYELDTNGNGYIESEELLQMFLAAGVKVGSKKFQSLLRAADENNDGVISYDEWVKVVDGMCEQ